MKKGIALILFLTMSILGYLQLDGATDRATMYLEEGISQKQAIESLEQEEEQEKKIPAVFFEKTVATDLEADILNICGEARLLTFGMATLTSEDVKGCLISEALATKLFKSSKVIGNQVLLEDNEYIVRGVYAGANLQLIRLNQDDKLLFNQVRVLRQEHEMAATTLQTFAQRHGLRGDILQWTEYVGIVKGLLLLSLVLLAIKGWSWLQKVMQLLPWSWLKKEFVRKIFLIIYVSAGLILLARQIDIPIEMIPAKWSDFAYWSEWFKSIIQNLGNVLFLEKGGYEQRFLVFGVCSIVGSVGAIALVFPRGFLHKTLDNHPPRIV